MATVLAEAAMTLRADDRKLRRGLGRSMGNIRSWAGGVARAVGPAAAALAGVGSVVSFAGLIGGSVKAAAELESVTVAFETMLGSANKANKLLGGMRAFSDATPFEPDAVIDAGRMLLAFGVSADQVVPSLRTLGDTAAGLNIPLGELAELYGKARVQGRLFMEDINQLTGRGIPITTELAKQFGVAESEVRDLVSAGKVGFPELQKAMAAMSGEGGQFAGLMEKQSQTLLGLVSTLKGRIRTVMQEIGESIIDELNLKEGLGRLIQGFTGWKTRVVDLARSAARGVGKAVKWVVGVGREVLPLVVSWGKMITTQIRAIGEMAAAVANRNVRALAWVGEHLGVNLRSWEDWKRGILTAHAAVETGFANWQKSSRLALLYVMKGGIDLRDRLQDIFQNDLPAILRFAAEHWSTILMGMGVKAFEIVKGTVKDVGGAMLAGIKNIASKVASVFSKIWTVIKSMGRDGAVDLLNTLKNLNPGDMLDGFKAKFLPSEDELKTSFEEDLERLKKILSETEVSSPLADQLSDEIKQIQDELKRDFERRRDERLNPAGPGVPGEDGDEQPRREFEIEERAPKMPGADELAGAAGSERNGFVGLQERYRQVQESALGQDKDERLIAEVGKVAKVGEKQADQEKRDAAKAQGMLARLVELSERQNAARAGFAR